MTVHANSPHGPLNVPNAEFMDNTTQYCVELFVLTVQLDRMRVAADELFGNLADCTACVTANAGYLGMAWNDNTALRVVFMDPLPEGLRPSERGRMRQRVTIRVLETSIRSDWADKARTLFTRSAAHLCMATASTHTG